MPSLQVGIVGLPNVGKSTLFNALASRRLAETAPRPFTTIEPHEAVVPLPDSDLDGLEKLIKPERTAPATVTFIDIAGLVKDAHKGEGLGNQFLAKIREVDAIVHVVRAFYDPAVVSEASDFETGSLEQVLDDVETINIELELGGIADKPVLVVLNVGEDDINSFDTKEKIIAVTEKYKTDTLAISAKIEEDLIDFDEKEKGEYLTQSGIAETGLEKLIKKAYTTLDLISFYTIKGGKEVHAWSLERGKSAIEAAERVHTDFAQKFIKAEVVDVKTLLDAGSWKNAKDKGLVRLEGRDYKVCNKDVIEFKVGS
jgi:ribosome-binding ATPase